MLKFINRNAFGLWVTAVAVTGLLTIRYYSLYSEANQKWGEKFDAASQAKWQNASDASFTMNAVFFLVLLIGGVLVACSYLLREEPEVFEAEGTVLDLVDLDR